MFYFAYLFSSELDQGNSSDNQKKKDEEQEYVNQIPCFFIPPPLIYYHLSFYFSINYFNALNFKVGFDDSLRS